MGREWPGALLARRTRTVEQCSFDARSNGQPWPLSSREVKRIGGISLGLLARPGRSIAKKSEGGAGEKYLPAGGPVRKLRAVEDQSVPIPER